jgi:transposase InsO family protein
MCKVLKISRSSFYHWYRGVPSKRYKENELFTKLIAKEYDLSKKRYGSPKIGAILRSKGYSISEKRVAKIMRSNGWFSITKKRFKVTTDSKHKEPICKNILNREFKQKRLNQAWVSDITYIKTNTGWLYLTTVIDLYDHQVIGWALSTTMHTSKTIIPAWNMAVSKRKIEKPLIFHSDRGIQYACKEFRDILKRNIRITQSMSRKGNCWDNAVAESFFKILKSELVYHRKFKNQDQAKIEVFEFIEIWYNRQRIHASLDYKTPIQMENEFYINQKLAA